MFHDGHLLIILHDVPEPGVPERKGLLFWRDPEASWRTSTGGGGFVRLTQLLDRYATRVDLLETLMANARNATAYFEVLKQGNPLRRAANNVYNALQQAREAVGDKEIISARDRADDITRAANLVVEDAKHALDFAMALQAEQQNAHSLALARSAGRLNKLAALFLPLTGIASVFGMNLASGLEATTPLAFWAVIGAGLGIGIALGLKLGRDEPNGDPPSLQGMLPMAG